MFESNAVRESWNPSRWCTHRPSQVYGLIRFQALSHFVHNPILHLEELCATLTNIRRAFAAVLELVLGEQADPPPGAPRKEGDECPPS